MRECTLANYRLSSANVKSIIDFFPRLFEPRVVSFNWPKPHLVVELTSY